ncbi:MAG: pseudouridine synthase [Chlorobi bacterium]|nr:pseudouridine synthase [Chlorobiota bacterium]
MVIAFNKPYGVLSQFTPEHPTHRTLSEFQFPPRVYPVGRLDLDSEGLLILSEEKWIVSKLLEPSERHPRTYWALVERLPSAESLAQIEQGIVLGGYRTLPARSRILDPQPVVPPRVPPVRIRKSFDDVWIEIVLVEGKYRQVRRMFAAIGHPVIRLIREGIGRLRLNDLALPIGQWRQLSVSELRLLLER